MDHITNDDTSSIINMRLGVNDLCFLTHKIYRTSTIQDLIRPSICTTRGSVCSTKESFKNDDKIVTRSIVTTSNYITGLIAQICAWEEQVKNISYDYGQYLFLQWFSTGYIVWNQPYWLIKGVTPWAYKITFIDPRKRVHTLTNWDEHL